MKSILLVAASCSLLTTAVLAAERPNIVWMITEDMSPHFGCYGERAIETPNWKYIRN